MKSSFLRPASVVGRLQLLEAQIDTVLFARPEEEVEDGSRNGRVLAAGAVGAGAAGGHVLIKGQGGYRQVGNVVGSAVGKEGKLLAKSYTAGREIGGLNPAQSAARAASKRLKSIGRKVLTSIHR